MSWFDFLSNRDNASTDPPRAPVLATMAIYGSLLLLGCSLYALSRAVEAQDLAQRDQLHLAAILMDMRMQGEAARAESERRDLELCRILMGEGLDGECRRVAMAGVEGGAK